MIKGIGVDIVETARVEKIIREKGGRFLDRTFTPREQAYCRRKKRGMYQSFGARFAAKEAVFKMLGTGWGMGVSWLQVEITNDPAGKPSVVLTGRARQRAEQLGISRVYLSVSHTAGYCAAFAVGE